MATEWAQVRQIMYEPSAVWLTTEYSGDRWLTDQFVLLCVTGLSALREYDFHVCLGYDPALGYEPSEGECKCPEEVPDGPYKLTVSKGVQPRASIPEPDIEAWFAKVAPYTWREAKPSEWSVAEHPGKAMLWESDGQAALVGEATWTAVKRHHPEVQVDYAPEGNLFRFSEEPHATPECYDGTCSCVPIPFCYAAGIKIPDGQEVVAQGIARCLRALDSTKQPEQGE